MRPRLKFRQMPGDYSKYVKIAMLEKDPARARRESVGAAQSDSLASWARAAKSFRATLKLRERAVLERRWRRELD